MTKNKTAAKKTEDQSVVYKVPAAFALMVLVIYGFWKLGSYYATLSGFSALYDLFGVLRLVLLAVLIVVCVLAFLLKAPLAKTLCRYGAAALALLIWCYVRIFSRKVAARSEENRKYLSYRNRFFGSFRLLKSCFRQRKDYAFFRCPSCREVVRVPRGKGKIRITCPRCGYAFEKKT